MTPTISSHSVAGISEEEVPAIIHLKKRERESYKWNPDYGQEIIEGGRIKWSCNRCTTKKTVLL